MITAEVIIDKINKALLDNNNNKKEFYSSIEDFFEYDDVIEEINKLSMQEALILLAKVKNANPECKHFVEYISESCLDEKFYPANLDQDDIYTKLFLNEYDTPVDNEKTAFKNIFEIDAQRLDNLKKNLDQYVIMWIEKDLKKLSTEDYNSLLIWMQNKRFK